MALDFQIPAACLFTVHQETDTNILVWEEETLELKGSILLNDCVEHAAFDKVGTTAAFSCYRESLGTNSTVILVWNLETGSKVADLFTEGEALNICFMSTKPGHLVVKSKTENSSRLQFWDFESNQEMWLADYYSESKFSIHFSGDETMIVSVGNNAPSHQPEITLWNSVDGSEIAHWASLKENIMCLDVNLQGDTTAVCCGRTDKAEQIDLWNVYSRELMSSIPLMSPIMTPCFAFSFDASVLAVGSKDGIFLVELSSEPVHIKKVSELNAHSLSFNSMGTKLAIKASDRGVVFDIPSLSVLKTWPDTDSTVSTGGIGERVPDKGVILIKFAPSSTVVLM